MSVATRPSSVSPVLDPVTLDTLRVAIEPVRAALLAHPVYGAVDSLPRLRRFMSHHVFAVWDFMCLAKRLQRDLTSLDELWLPPSRPSLARFINSVVHGEESDIDQNGAAASHFELYLSAMDEVGAPRESIEQFITAIRGGAPVDPALVDAGASAPVRAFVAHTLDTVRRGSTIEVLSAFLFGREDLIPEMFARLLPQWAEVQQAHRFVYYVQRHIELDGDEHGPAGLRALAEMAGDDRDAWRLASTAAASAITARIALWDGVLDDLRGI